MYVASMLVVQAGPSFGGTLRNFTRAKKLPHLKTWGIAVYRAQPASLYAF